MIVNYDAIIYDLMRIEGRLGAMKYILAILLVVVVALLVHETLDE